MLNRTEIRNTESEAAFRLENQRRNSTGEGSYTNVVQNSDAEEIHSSRRDSLRLDHFEDGEENIELGNERIVNINEYRERLSESVKKQNEDGSEGNRLLHPVYRSKLSAGNNDKFRFSDYEKNDTSRMEAVKTALESYYSLMREAMPDNADEEHKNVAEQERIREKTIRLQHIVTTCNRYIANRWPISKQGRERLSEVKRLRKEAIKELGEHAGHPGWRLAGEYIKFGIKAVTSPAWAPVAAVGMTGYYAGKWTGRVAKRIGKGIKKKAVGLAHGVAQSFSSWRAFGATLLAVGATLVWGTIANVINTAIDAVLFVPWLLASMVTAPRYLYHLAKGHVNLYGINKQEEGNYRCMAWSMPTPHRYSTWYRYFSQVYGISNYLHNYGAEHRDRRKNINKKGAENDDKLIQTNGRQNRYGEYDQYEVNAYNTFGLLGPVRDKYYHDTTLKFKKLYELLRYDNKDDFNQIAARAAEDYNTKVLDEKIEDYNDEND